MRRCRFCGKKYHGGGKYCRGCEKKAFMGSCSHVKWEMHEVGMGEEWKREFESVSNN